MQIAGIIIPPLIVRRASTTVELRDGQSFVIGGLLQKQRQTAQQQLPWLGDVPVLGALFRSTSYQKNETDLAIIVTPRLVRPARPGDVIKTPLDNTLPANDIDFFLMGKAEITPAVARMAACRPGLCGSRARPAEDLFEGVAMWSPSRTNMVSGPSAWPAPQPGAARRLGTMLAGCSDLYFERRETIALGARIATPTGWRRRSIRGRAAWPPPDRLQRQQDADRGRTLPDQPGDPAGQRHHQLGGLSGGRAGRGQRLNQVTPPPFSAPSGSDQVSAAPE